MNTDLKNLIENHKELLKNIFDKRGIKGLYDENLIRKETYNFFTTTDFQYRIDKSAIYNSLKIKLENLGYEKNANLSDILGGLTKNRLKVSYCHPDNYWKDDPSAVYSETFAELIDSGIASPIQYDTIREWMPTTVNEFEKMIKKILEAKNE